MKTWRSISITFLCRLTTISAANSDRTGNSGHFHTYLVDVGVQVHFVLGQTLVHAAQFGQRVFEGGVLRLDFIQQRGELCSSALRLKGRIQGKAQNFDAFHKSCNARGVLFTRASASLSWALSSSSSCLSTSPFWWVSLTAESSPRWAEARPSLCSNCFCLHDNIANPWLFRYICK